MAFQHHPQKTLPDSIPMTSSPPPRGLSHHAGWGMVAGVAALDISSSRAEATAGPELGYLGLLSSHTASWTCICCLHGGGPPSHAPPIRAATILPRHSHITQRTNQYRSQLSYTTIPYFFPAAGDLGFRGRFTAAYFLGFALAWEFRAAGLAPEAELRAFAVDRE